MRRKPRANHFYNCVCVCVQPSTGVIPLTGTGSFVTFPSFWRLKLFLSVVSGRISVGIPWRWSFHFDVVGVSIESRRVNGDPFNEWMQHALNQTACMFCHCWVKFDAYCAGLFDGLFFWLSFPVQDYRVVHIHYVCLPAFFVAAVWWLLLLFVIIVVGFC